MVWSRKTKMLFHAGHKLCPNKSPLASTIRPILLSDTSSIEHFQTISEDWPFQKLLQQKASNKAAQSVLQGSMSPWGSGHVGVGDVCYFSLFLTNSNFLPLENYLLNWKASDVWSMAQFKQDRKIIFPSIPSFCEIRSHRVDWKGRSN